MAAARRAGDAATEAAALVTLSCAEPIAGDVERIRTMLAEARTVASRVNAFQPLLGAAITESDMLEGAGWHEAAAAAAREGLSVAREHGLARTYGAVLANNVAEPLVSLGRWDEAGEIIEHALRLLPPPLSRSCQWRLAGDIALARGDLPAAAESVASMRSVLDRARYHDQYHLPLIRLETELRLAQQRPADALSAIGDALDRYMAAEPSLRLAVAGRGGRACAAAAAGRARGHGDGAARSLAGRGGRADRGRALQEAHRLTFAAAEAERPGDASAAWDEALSRGNGRPALSAGLALLRSAEAALGTGDRDSGATRLRRAAELAQQLGARPLGDDITLLARRARIPLARTATGSPRRPSRISWD